MILALSFAVDANESSSEKKSQITENIPYYSQAIIDKNAYIKKRSVLDVYCPKSKSLSPAPLPTLLPTLLPTIIWFHGGGLSGGQKHIPSALKNKGVCVVAPNYRLHPKVKSPVYIEDAAAAVAWVFKNIGNYGGDSSKIFVSGHSAGGYLASMIGLDKKWLSAHNVDADNIAGLIPFSGHTITHFTVRKERGISGKRPIIDELAPLYHVRADAPPLLLITGDRELEMLGRYEENAYMMRMMKVVGHKQTRILELDGYGHNIVGPALPLLLKEVNRLTKENKQ